MLEEKDEQLSRKINRAQVIQYWQITEEEISTYYEHVPGLLGTFPYEIAIPYVFSRLELVQMRALRIGLVIRYKAHFESARLAVDQLYRTRAEVDGKFKLILGSNLDDWAMLHLRESAKIRDKVLHGLNFTKTDCLFAIRAALVYSHFLHEFMMRQTGVSPFKTLRGINWGIDPLPKETTRYMLMGMGFYKGNKNSA